jgi:chromosome segregation ATPase
MTIEQLQEENKKLNARLAKAVAVFKEQKENLDRLTAERDSAKADIVGLSSRITELEAKLQEKSSDDTKFFEQLEEISKLEEQLAENKVLYDGIASQNEQFRKELSELENKHRDLTIDYNSSKSAYKELGNEYKDYVQKTNDKLAQNQDTINDLTEKNQDLVTALDNLTNRYETTIAQYTTLINNMVQMVKDRTVSLVKDVEKLNNPG